MDKFKNWIKKTDLKSKTVGVISAVLVGTVGLFVLLWKFGKDKLPEFKSIFVADSDEKKTKKEKKSK